MRWCGDDTATRTAVLVELVGCKMMAEEKLSCVHRCKSGGSTPLSTQTQTAWETKGGEGPRRVSVASACS